jgi:hypothetical protein
MAKTKGTTLVAAVRFLRSRREQAREVLPPELRHYLDERINESSWYPESDLSALVDATASLLPGERDEVLANMGVHTAREHLDGVYSHLRLEDPASMSRRALALWASQHDSGRFDVATVAPGEIRMTVRDFAHPTKTLCGILTGYFVETVRIAGLTSPTIRKDACVLRGDEACIWTVVHDTHDG